MKPFFEDDEVWNKAKEELLTWLGTPYLHGYGVKHRGTDCNQFIGHFLMDIGVLKKIETEYYSPQWYLHTDREIILEYLKQHEKHIVDWAKIFEIDFKNEELMRGDYLGFSIGSNKGLVNHSGLLLDDNTFIASQEDRGVAIYDMSKHWLKLLKRVYRVMRVK